MTMEIKMRELKINPYPILKMLIVSIFVIISIIFIFNSQIIVAADWVMATIVHVPQFLIPFVLIYYLSKGEIKEYGFNLNEDPPEFTYKRMLMIGSIFGLFFSLRFFFQFFNAKPIEVPVPITVVSVFGNMAFQWIVVGLCEETMFRGLIQTYLMNNLDDQITLFGHDLHIGTIIGAIFWGGFHFIEILLQPLWNVIGLVLITTIIGLFMGYAYQRTRSLLTTIIVHNSIFGIPLTISYILYFLS